ncbi:Pleckstrin homology domain-containing family N member 1, partial [Microtus ochrogaster]
IPGLENQPENLEQPFLSVFKKGWRRTPVRNLGKVVHYSKVQLRFQHSQDISDCYLELFPSHLYFQAHGSEGLTFQGLLPLTELSICRIDGSREHAFQITGPLPAPLLVLCHSEAELSHWLYHLEKQMALLGGLQRCHSSPPQSSLGDELPWTRLWRVSGCESMGSAICASRVKLQHLPSQEQWDRILVLYPASLAIFSEDPDGLTFKGELPLSAIHINLEEKEKEIRSFLIEGRLINTIRVVCASYEDYSQWLLCLRTVSHRDGAHRLPGPENFPGLHGPTKNQTNSNCVSTGRKKTELRHSGSSQSPRGKVRREVSGSAVPLPLHLDLTKVSELDLDSSSEAQDHSSDIPHSPLYADPYTPPATSHRKITDLQGLDEVSALLGGYATVRSGDVRSLKSMNGGVFLGKGSLGFTVVPDQGFRKPTFSQQFFCAMQTSPGPELSSPFPSVSVSVPVSDSSSGISSSPRPLGSHLLSKKGALQPRASQKHRGSIKNRGPRPSDLPQLVTPARESTPSSLPPPPDEEAPNWNKTSSPSPQKWPQLRKTPVEMGLIQWI